MVEHAIDGTSLKAPRFPGEGSVLVTPTREASLSVTRFAPADVRHGYDIRMPGEEAFVVVFQLKEHPRHDFWLGDRYLPAAAAPSATLNIVDLTEEPYARITEPIDKLMFHVPRPALDEIAREAAAYPVAHLAAPEGWLTMDPVVDALAPVVLRALCVPQQTNRLLQDHLLLGLTAHFAVTYGGMRPRRTIQRGGLAPWQERRATELLGDSLSRQLSLADIARECELSPAYFARAFKVSTGVTPHAWLQDLRVQRAQSMLSSSSQGLAEIAIACGFADQSHFTRVFSRHAGVTPGAWRRSRKDK